MLRTAWIRFCLGRVEVWYLRKPPRGLFQKGTLYYAPDGDGGYRMHEHFIRVGKLRVSLLMPLKPWE